MSFFPHLNSWTQENPTHELVGEYPRLRILELGSKIKEKEKLDKTKPWKL